MKRLSEFKDEEALDLLANILTPVAEIAQDESVDLQTLEDTMDMVEGDFLQKADGYAKVLQQMNTEVEILDKEIKRLQARKKRNQSCIDRMKRHLQDCMTASGMKKFQTDLFNFMVKRCNPKLIIDEIFLENIPEEYLLFQDPAINKEKIKVFNIALVPILWMKVMKPSSRTI